MPDIRPTIEVSPSGNHVLVLCRFRHIIDAVRIADWPGSHIEARASNAMACPTCEMRDA